MKMYFLMCAAVLLAPALAEGQFLCATNHGGITITRYTGPGGLVAIPDATNNLPVTAIGPKAFFGNTQVTAVTLGRNVKRIGYFAFHGCTNLAAIDLGDNTTVIEKNAFGTCGLRSITIPDSVTNLGDYVFALDLRLTNAVIGDKVLKIGQETFARCFQLRSVVMGAAVRGIGMRAFMGCTNLTAVTIPNGVGDIGPDAFMSCLNLTNIAVGSGATNIGARAFSCGRLKAVGFLGNAPQADATTFAGNPGATVYYLPGTKGWGATFAGCATAPWKR